MIWAVVAPAMSANVTNPRRRPHLALPIASDRPVILYDEHGSGEQLEEIACKFRASGFADVRILDGGFAAYKAANEPSQEPSTEQVVPPTAPQEVQALDRRL